MLELALVLVEQAGPAPSSDGLELVAAARGIARRVEAAVLGGEGVAAETLGAHGVACCHELGGAGESLPAPRVAAALAQLVAGSPPGAVLLASTTTGRDVAGRLSARLDRPVLANVVGMELEADRIVVHNSAFGGTLLVSTRYEGEDPAIVLVRSKSFVAEEAGGQPASVVQAPLPGAGAAGSARVLERRRQELAGPALEEAAVVVAGGRGLGSAEHYGLVERLAALLHGAPGASRAIVDAGWAPYACQVGQTGKTVRPDVYLAFGISGAMQHLVGMRGARHVVAVNKDPAAPIFQLAELGVVGDAPDLLRRLVARLEAPGGAGAGDGGK